MDLEVILKNERIQKVELESTEGFIYFLVRQKRIVYVGQTRHLHSRIATHRIGREKKFDEAYFFSLPRNDMYNIEDGLITTLKPEYNRHNITHPYRKYDLKLLKKYGFGYLIDGVRAEE